MYIVYKRSFAQRVVTHNSTVMDGSEVLMKHDFDHNKVLEPNETRHIGIYYEF